MDLINKLQDVANRFHSIKEQVGTEEATKNAFVMPFLQALGYDVFNPLEVVPEFTADLGTKKGEKVDYCILKDGNPAIIIECKHWTEELNNHQSQLHRYFHVTKSRFAILTNGHEFLFFTDLERPNIMDDKPFLEFRYENINDNVINELKKFQKEQFDINRILVNASDLKYSKAIKNVLSQELKNPSGDFTRHFISKVYNGKITKKVFEQFEPLVQKSTKILLSELVSERLQTALSKEEEDSKAEIEEVEVPRPDEKGILTTDEEIEAYRIVQAIVRRSFPLDRVTMRDAKSYCSIIIDNNNRKPLCRFWFNGNKKHIGIFDSEKHESKQEIEQLEDIYAHEGSLLATVEQYLI